MIKFRNLRADEMECRVQSIMKNGKGCILLIYKDARCDMSILDETVGVLGWQRRHLRDNANCVVSLWDEEKKQWIEKEDTGSESNTEAKKGQASDSFKRACFNFGIGRELYTSPFIYIALQQNEVHNNRLASSVKFHVQYVETSEDKKITKLTIADQNNKVRFIYPYKTRGKEIITSQEAQSIFWKYLCNLNLPEKTINVLYKKLDPSKYIKDGELNNTWKDHIKIMVQEFCEGLATQLLEANIDITGENSFQTVYEEFNYLINLKKQNMGGENGK